MQLTMIYDADTSQWQVITATGDVETVFTTPSLMEAQRYVYDNDPSAR